MKNLLYVGNKLSSHGFSVTTIETLGPLLEKEGFQVFYASTKKNKFFRMAEMLWKVLKLRKKIDCVLIDTYSTSNFWYAFLVSQWAKALKIKYIPILHGGNLPRRLQTNLKACQMIFSNAYKNVSPSNYLLEAFLKTGFKNLEYIPNSIEIQNYPFKSRSEIVPKLLWVRAFAEIYNPIMAIEVYRELKFEYPEAVLCMVGSDKDGALEKAKLYAEKYNLDVTFTGHLSKPDWIALSSDYSIFLNTSRFDNAPVSAIEAMALGLAIVSTDVGGIPYLLEHKKDALLVENENVHSMAAAVREAVKNTEESKNRIASARQKAASFDWEIVKKSWKEILN